MERKSFGAQMLEISRPESPYIIFIVASWEAEALTAARPRCQE